MRSESERRGLVFSNRAFQRPRHARVTLAGDRSPVFSNRAFLQTAPRWPASPASPRDRATLASVASVARDRAMLARVASVQQKTAPSGAVSWLVSVGAGYLRE